MSRSYRFLAAAIWLAGGATSGFAQIAGTVPALPDQTTISVTSGTSSANNIATWTATVRTYFSNPMAQVTNWGTATKSGNTFTIGITAAASTALPPVGATGHTYEHAYSLGALAAGTYHVVVRSQDHTLADQSFTVPGSDSVAATAAISVDATHAAAVVAKVHVDFQNYYAVTGQAAPRIDGTNYILEATVEPVAVIAIFPPPPFPKADLTYQLGAVAPGTYTAVFKINDQTKAEQAFTVPTPTPATVQFDALSVVPNPTGLLATLSIRLSYSIGILNPGQPTVTGNRIAVNIRTVQMGIPITPDSPPYTPATLTYQLPALAAGDYTFTLAADPQEVGTKPFHVDGTTAPLAHVTFTKSDTSAGETVIKARVEFTDWYYVLSDPGTAVRDGTRFTVSAKAEKVTFIQAPQGPMIAEPTYNLGKLDVGTYSLVYKINDAVVGQFSFAVTGTPPPPVGAELAFVDVHKNDTGGYSAEVGVLLPAVQRVKAWGDPHIDHPDGKNRISVSLTLEDAPTPVVDPLVGGANAPAGDLVFQAQAPLVVAGDDPANHVSFVLARHTYDLGALAAGDYIFAVLVGDKLIGQRPFHIQTDGPPPPPPPAVASIEISSDSAGSWFAMVQVVLSKPDQTVLDWGEVTADGSVFKVNLTIGAAPVGVGVVGDVNAAGAVVNGLRPLLSHKYALGSLAPGDYSFVVTSDGQQLGLRLFHVEAAPPPPPPPQPHLAYIEIKQGDASTAAEVGIVLPPGKGVTDWGEVKRDGQTLMAAVTFGDVPILDPVLGAGGDANDLVTPSSLVRHTYSLGVLETGVYKFVLSNAADQKILGAREFRVGEKPPPPPPVPPIVAYIRVGMDTTGWFSEVGLAFTSPGTEVKDWGTPVIDGNKFKVGITTGPATLTPVDPAGNGAGNVAGAEPPSVVGADEVAGFNEIGGWPVTLVHHRYALGLLAAGEYVFVVAVDGSELAHQSFVVQPTVTPGPVVTLAAKDILAKSDAPETFTINYNAAAGWAGDPAAGTVTVKGPHDFSAVAILKGVIVSADILGRIVIGTYEVGAPGGTWDAADDGEYQVNVDPKAVTDKNGKTVPKPGIGVFHVRILPDPPPPALKAEVAISMQDGKWQADVSFDNTGGWFRAEWGDVLPHGSVFATFATLITPPFGSLVPIPVSFSHTYPLGELKPGHYDFVFKSSAGHVATAPVNVPGVEPPTPLAAYMLNVAGSTDSNADLDSDGASTLLEYYFGSPPLLGTLPDIKPSIVVSDGQPHLALNYHRIIFDDQIVCTVQVSSDMTHWQDAGALVDIIAGDPDVDGTQPVCACQKASLDQSQWRFMRLHIEKPAAP